MSLGLLLGFLMWLKHLCLYIGSQNAYVDTLSDHYMKIGLSLREDSLGSWIVTLVLIKD